MATPSRETCVRGILGVMCGHDRMALREEHTRAAAVRKREALAAAMDDHEAKAALRAEVTAWRRRGDFSTKRLSTTVQQWNAKGVITRGYQCRVFEMDTRLAVKAPLGEIAAQLQDAYDADLPPPPLRQWREILYRASVNAGVYRRLLALCLSWGPGGVVEDLGPLAESIAKGCVTVLRDPHLALHVLRMYPEVVPTRQLLLGILTALPRCEAHALLRSPLMTERWGYTRDTSAWISGALALTECADDVAGILAAAGVGSDTPPVTAHDDQRLPRTHAHDRIHLAAMDAYLRLGCPAACLQYFRRVRHVRAAHARVALAACEAGCVERHDVFYETAYAVGVEGRARLQLPPSHNLVLPVLRLCARFRDAGRGEAVVAHMVAAGLPLTDEAVRAAEEAGVAAKALQGPRSLHAAVFESHDYLSGA